MLKKHFNATLQPLFQSIDLSATLHKDDTDINSDINRTTPLQMVNIPALQKNGISDWVMGSRQAQSLILRNELFD